MSGGDGALNVEGLHVELGGRKVLNGVDLTVTRGELVGLIGPNGAGKTTLLRSILGLLRPTRGHILIDGRPSAPGRAGLGYVPQRHEFAWDFPISVEGTVMTGRTSRLGLGRRPGENDWRAVADALRRVEMTQLRTRPVGELSGGQRQRVLVARALAAHPSVLLLDEPFTGLDMPTTEMLTELFGSLAAEGHAVLMTTHDIAAAFHACDRLALLNRRIVASGRPDELRDADVWMRTFGVSETNPLLTIVKAA